MKPVTLQLITLIFLLLMLTTLMTASLQTTPYVHTEPLTMPAGSVPICSEMMQIDYQPNYPIHFIGDSRTVGMEQALSYYGYDLSNHSFTAQIGKGYSWLAAQTSLTKQSPSILVINLGVNDLGNVTRYQKLYETYVDSCWSHCPIYIISVNPCCSPCTCVSNQQIEAFNSSMQTWIQQYNEENASDSTKTFPIRYIDTYHMLLSEGYSSPDGLHYSAATYEHIYSYIMENIQESIGDGTGSYSYYTYQPSS